MKALRNQGPNRIEIPINGKDKPPLAIEAGSLINLSDKELRGVEAAATDSDELQDLFSAFGDHHAALVLLELDGHGRPIETATESQEGVQK